MDGWLGVLEELHAPGLGEMNRKSTESPRQTASKRRENQEDASLNSRVGGKAERFCNANKEVMSRKRR
jgi:hypothetical protein